MLLLLGDCVGYVGGVDASCVVDVDGSTVAGNAVALVIVAVVVVVVVVGVGCVVAVVVVVAVVFVNCGDCSICVRRSCCLCC